MGTARTIILLRTSSKPTRSTILTINVRWETSALAANGLEVVNEWEAGNLRLLFIDIGMPVMNGREATKEVRRLERKEDDDSACCNKQLREPVVIGALTAPSLPVDIEGELNPGCNDFITKSSKQALLPQKVEA